MNTLIFFQKTRKLLFSSLLVACSLILNAQHVNVTLWVCNQIDSLETEAQQTSFINFLKVPYDSIDLNVCIKRIPCPSDLNCQEYTDGFCIYSDLNDPNALDILIVPGDLNPSCQKWNGMCVAGRAILGGDTSYAIYDPTATIARHELGHMLGLFHTYHGTQCLEDPNNEYPGDFVDDTPVSPDPEDVVYVNMQGGPIDWANTLDECMQNFNTQHDPGNVLQPNLMSQYNFQNKVTQGQITRMRTIISTTHVGKTTSVATPCPWASSVHVGDVNSVTSWSGGTELNGEIVITDTLNVEGNIHVGSSAKITVLERGVLNITNANFGSKCGESWSGIFVEEGGVITISNATIWNAETGLSLRGIVTHANGSGNGSSINGLTFNGCDVSLKINNCGDASYEPSSSVHLVKRY